MARFSMMAAIASLATSVSATGILLPLYLYPSVNYNDGAANWKPAFDAMSAESSVDWLAVVNYDSGPGNGQPGSGDVNYINGTAQLNGRANVKTIGYVHTLYAKADMDTLKANITAWNGWSSYSDEDISVHGIFFDESAEDYSYMSEAISFARQTFGSEITTICNFGTSTTAEYYGICDVVVAFESCLNCSDGPPFEGQSTLDANIPSNLKSQAAVIINEFTGTAEDGSAADASLLQTDLNTISSDGVGWTYFCSAGYDSLTTGPATVGQNAQDLSSE